MPTTQTPTWRDATWGNDTNWEAVHAVIGSMADHERGWYRGLFDAWAYAQAQTNAGRTLTCDAPEGYGYSPSGQARIAESFYSGPPEQPADMVQVTFDPLKFLCMAADCDSEASLVYVCYTEMPAVFGPSPYLRVHISSTETNRGIPKWWPKVDTVHASEIWRPFAWAAAFNERIKGST